jgi:chromosome segregation ATPase
MIFSGPEMSSFTETQLIADIEQLRAKFTGTQDLYREVCALMFFRYGVTPTANKLYQYVRKGSMSAPAEALGKFWSDLREKSRVRIEHPDLPEEVKGAAGELVAALWKQAQERAGALLEAHEAEARTAVMEAKAGMEQSAAQRNALHAEALGLQEKMDQAAGEIAALRQQLAGEAASRAALQTQLAQAHADIVALRQANDKARTDFTVEIGKLSDEAQREKERLRAAERRALLEIDRERGMVDKLQKELAAARADFLQQSERHKLESAGMHQQIGDMRERIGALEGQLTATKTHAEEVGRDLQNAHRQLAEAASRAASLERERSDWQIKAAAAEKALGELKNRALGKEKSRKAGAMPPGS